MADQVVYRIVVDAGQALATIDQITARSRAAIGELDRLANKPRRTQTDSANFATTAGQVRADLKTQKSVAEAAGDPQRVAAVNAALRDLEKSIQAYAPRGEVGSREVQRAIKKSEEEALRTIKKANQNYGLMELGAADSAKELAELKKEVRKLSRAAKKAAQAQDAAATASETVAAEAETEAKDASKGRGRGRQARQRQAAADEQAAKAKEQVAADARAEASGKGGNRARRERSEQAVVKANENLAAATNNAAANTAKAAERERQLAELRAKAAQSASEVRRVRGSLTPQQEGRLTTSDLSNIESALLKLDRAATGQTSGGRKLQFSGGEGSALNKLFEEAAVDPAIAKTGGAALASVAQLERQIEKERKDAERAASRQRREEAKASPQTTEATVKADAELADATRRETTARNAAAKQAAETTQADDRLEGALNRNVVNLDRPGQRGNRGGFLGNAETERIIRSNPEIQRALAQGAYFPTPLPGAEDPEFQRKRFYAGRNSMGVVGNPFELEELLGVVTAKDGQLKYSNSQEARAKAREEIRQEFVKRSGSELRPFTGAELRQEAIVKGLTPGRYPDFRRELTALTGTDSKYLPTGAEIDASPKVRKLIEDRLASLKRTVSAIDDAIYDSLDTTVSGSRRVGYIPGVTGPNRLAFGEQFAAAADPTKVGAGIEDPKAYKEAVLRARQLQSLEGNIVQGPRFKGDDFRLLRLNAESGKLEQVISTNGPIVGKNIEQLAANYSTAVNASKEIARLSPDVAETYRSQGRRLQSVVTSEQARIDRINEGIERFRQNPRDPRALDPSDPGVQADLFNARRRQEDFRIRQQALFPGTSSPEEIASIQRFSKALDAAGQGKTFQDDTGRIPNNLLIPEGEKLTQAQRKQVQDRINAIQSGREIYDPETGATYPAPAAPRRVDPNAAFNRRVRANLTPDLIASRAPQLGYDTNAFLRIFQSGNFRSFGGQALLPNVIKDLPFGELRELASGFGVKGRGRDDILNRLGARYQAAVENLDKYATSSGALSTQAPAGRVPVSSQFAAGRRKFDEELWKQYIGQINPNEGRSLRGVRSFEDFTKFRQYRGLTPDAPGIPSLTGASARPAYGFSGFYGPPSPSGRRLNEEALRRLSEVAPGLDLSLVRGSQKPGGTEFDAVANANRARQATRDAEAERRSAAVRQAEEARREQRRYLNLAQAAGRLPEYEESLRGLRDLPGLSAKQVTSRFNVEPGRVDGKTPRQRVEEQLLKEKAQIEADLRQFEKNVPNAVTKRLAYLRTTSGAGKLRLDPLYLTPGAASAAGATNPYFNVSSPILDGNISKLFGVSPAARGLPFNTGPNESYDNVTQAAYRRFLKGEFYGSQLLGNPVKGYPDSISVPTEMGGLVRDEGAGRATDARQARERDARLREERRQASLEERAERMAARQQRIAEADKQLEEISARRASIKDERYTITRNIQLTEERLRASDAEIAALTKAELQQKLSEIGVKARSKAKKGELAALYADSTRESRRTEAFTNIAARSRVGALGSDADLQAAKASIGGEISKAGGIDNYLAAKTAAAKKLEGEAAQAERSILAARTKAQEDLKAAEAISKERQFAAGAQGRRLRQKLNDREERLAGDSGGSGDGTVVDSSSRAMVNAQRAKATAANKVATALGNEEASADLATEAQLRKAAAAEAVAIALEGQLRAIAGNTGAQKAQAAAANNAAAATTAGTAAAPRGTKRARTREARGIVDEQTEKNLLDAEVLRQSNDESTRRGRKSIAARREVELQNAINAILEERIRVEARLTALKARSAADVQRQQAQETEISAILLQDQVNALKSRAAFSTPGGQTFATLEASKQALLAEEQALITQINAQLTARLALATKLSTLEAEVLAYQNLGVAGQRRLAQAEAKSALIAEEQAALRAKALNDPALRGRYVNARASRITDEGYTKTLTDAEVASRRRAQLNDPTYRAALEQSKLDNAKIALIEQEIAAQAKINAAKNLTAAEVQASAALQLESNLIKIREQKALLAAQKASDVYAREEAELAVLQRQINQQKRREYRRAIRSAEGIPLTERLGLRGYPGAGAGAGGGATLTSSLGTTARYGASSFLLFGALGGLAMSIKTAEELEKTLNQVEAQFEALGRSSKEFGEFRVAILDIAATTGTSADEVANLAFQFQGAFGGNTLKTITETAAAIEAVKVTGLSLKETIDAFTALTQSYRDQGVTIADVSDKALGLQERFGVLAKETISFAADLAPVGEAAGFSIDELEALGATAQKFSGKSGASLAEAFGRIIPQVQSQSVEIISLLSRIGEEVPEFEDAVPGLIRALGQNDVQDFFAQLIPLYGKLTQSQKNYVLDLIGSRRETQSLVGVLENGGQLLAEWEGGFDDTGKTADRFSKLQETLTQRLARFGEQMKQIGVEVFEGGLGDALKQLINVFSLLGQVFGTVLGTVGSIVGAFDGFGAKVLIALGAVKLLIPALKALQAVSLTPTLGRAGAALRGTPTPGYNGFYGPPTPYGFGGYYGPPLPGGYRPTPPYQYGRIGTALANSRALPTVGPALAQAGAGAKIAGSALMGAFGGPVGLAAVGALVGYQLVSGWTEGANKAAREAAESEFEPLVRSIKNAREDGGVLGEAEKRQYEILRNAALGGNVSKQSGGSLARSITGADTSNFGEFLSELGPDGNDLLGGRTARSKEMSDAELEEIKAARRALVELEAENFKNMVIALSDESMLMFQETSYLLFAAADELKADGKTLTSGGSTDPAGVLSALQAKGDFDFSALSGQLDLNGEKVEFSESDVEKIVVKNQLDQDLSDEEIRIVLALQEAVAPENRDRLPKVLRDILDEADKQAASDETLANLDLQAKDYQKLFESGDIGLGVYLQEQQKILTEAEGLAKDGTNKKAIEQAKTTREQVRKTMVDAAKGELEAFKTVGELSGGRPEDLLPRLVAQLDDPNFNQADRAAVVQEYIAIQKQALDTMIGNAESTSEALAIANAGLAVDPAVQAEFIRQQLAQYNQAYQELLLSVGLSGEVSAEVTEDVAKRMAETGETLNEALRAVIEARIKSLKALIASVPENISIVKTALGEFDVASIRKEILELEAALGGIDSAELEDPAELGNIGVDAQKKAELAKRNEEERRQKNLDIRKSQLDLYKSQRPGDAAYAAALDRQAAELDLAAAQAEGDIAGVNRAMAAINAANFAAQEVGIRVQQARISFMRSLVSGNGVLVAQYDRQSAELDLQLARSRGDEAGIIAAEQAIAEADRNRLTEADNQLKARLELQKARNGDNALLNSQIDQQIADIDLRIAQRTNDVAGEASAMAARINADRAVQEAMLRMRESQISIILAQANALDDSVRVAEIGIEQAQIALERARISGNPDAIREAEAQIITANDALHDAQLQEMIDSQQFLFDMGKLSRGQFVEFLKSLLGMAGNSEKDIQNIQRQIKQLQGELSSDFQFNLPTSLGLPTLYESRRVNQSRLSYAGALGAGYQDNRNVQININVNNTADQAAVVAAIDSALGTPRTGTVARRY